jgi:hypothetical protein
MNTVTTETTNCFFKIAWTAPDNRGAPILEYKVEIQGTTKEFFTFNECGKDVN